MSFPTPGVSPIAFATSVPGELAAAPGIEQPFPFGIEVPGYSEQEVLRVVQYHWEFDPKRYWANSVANEESFIRVFPRMASQVPPGWTLPKEKTASVWDLDCPECKGRGYLQGRNPASRSGILVSLGNCSCRHEATLAEAKVFHEKRKLHRYTEKGINT